jgi:pimeloyl-ACP methyl ester carboxylesterase
MANDPRSDWQELGTLEKVGAVAPIGSSFTRRDTSKLMALAAAFCCVLAPVRGASAQQNPLPDFHPLVSIQHQDYPWARAHFHTKLLRVGPAPQSYKPVSPPAGVADVTYSQSLGLKGWLYRPTDGKRRHPAVLFLHGGYAFDMGDWDMTTAYRKAGFVVLAPRLRGENGQAGKFSMFYDEVDDVLAAANYLRRLPDVDPHRIFVAGHSVGGTMTLLAAESSKIFRAAASLSGSPDQVLYLKLAPGAKERAPFDYADERELVMRSPLAFAAYVKCPLRIYYGSDEPQFEFTSADMVKIGREHGQDVQIVVEQGNHNTHVSLSIPDSIKFFESFR